MLRIAELKRDAIILLLKPGPRQEYRIPVTNLGLVKASCEFKLDPGGLNTDMHTFYLMPFRYVINPGETVRVVVTIKYNVQSFNNEKFQKRSEMRKLLMVRIKDTNLNLGFPLIVKFFKPPESSPSAKSLHFPEGKDKLFSMLASFDREKDRDIDPKDII
jgi:hypothetical protein